MAGSLEGIDAWREAYTREEKHYIDLYGDSMAFTARQSTGADFEAAPAGTHIARCIRLIDLGTQVRKFKAETKNLPELRFVWELLGEERRDDGKPYIVQANYTNSDHEKSALHKMVFGWTNKPVKGFPLDKLVGAYCLLNVTHTDSNGTTYANVSGVSPLPKGFAKPEGSNDLIIFSLNEPDWAAFGKLHEKLQEKIKLSPEYAKAVGMREPGADEDEDAEEEFA